MNGSTTAVIAIDAMGGDIGLDTTIAAAVRAQNQPLERTNYLPISTSNVLAFAMLSRW